MNPSVENEAFSGDPLRAPSPDDQLSLDGPGEPEREAAQAAALAEALRLARAM